jgi:sugar phosphate isomerase/epimerase
MEKFSFQLFSSRNFPPLGDVFTLLAKSGYAYVEGFGGVYGDADEAAGKALKAQLDSAGLAMPTGHFSIDALEQDPAKVIAFAKIVGMEIIICPFLMPDQRPTDVAGWKAFGARLQKAGEPIKAAGFGFGWHNHDFEFATLEDGSVVIDRIFEGGPDLGWEADVAWIVRGKADPMEWIEKYKDRIIAVHVKDLAPAGENVDEGGWADVGHGTIGWANVMPAIRAKTKARYFIAEHDNPNNLERMVTRSIASFKAL